MRILLKVGISAVLTLMLLFLVAALFDPHTGPSGHDVFFGAWLAIIYAIWMPSFTTRHKLIAGAVGVASALVFGLLEIGVFTVWQSNQWSAAMGATVIGCMTFAGSLLPTAAAIFAMKMHAYPASLALQGQPK